MSHEPSSTARKDPTNPLPAALYRLSLKLYHLSIRLAALANPKAREWIRGRRDTVKVLRSNSEALNGCVWFHCASLGEFEQGRPIIEALKLERPEVPILVTFFSPSGYEVRKNYRDATLVTYLPPSSSRNARRFLRLVNPKVVVFVKYEFWYHYLVGLRRRRIPLIIVSANFRTDHWLFRRYAAFIATELKQAKTIYAQNPESWKRLTDAGFSNAILATDTRFDRVRATVDSGEGDELSSHFANGYFTLIAGSTWPEDEKLLVEVMHAHPGIKLIIAPHEVAKPNVSRVRRLFGESASLYSEGIAASYDARVLIIDNIGLLSRIYRHGSVAYVGGGFSGKLHNILEPAAFGLPVIFGPKFNDFPEAVEMIGIGAGYTVKGIEDISRVITRFKESEHVLKAAGREAREFVDSNVGGTTPVVDELKQCLDQV